MKKWIIITLSIGAFMILTVRLFNKHVNGGNDERLWYVQHLNFYFSAQVDSLFFFPRAKRGLIFFHKTNGEFRLSTEDELNTKLNYNGNLRFILNREYDKLALHTINVDQYQTGDSIVINTDSNRISIYRQGKPVSECEISPSLSGRPF